jgi:hypothetical protein
MFSRRRVARPHQRNDGHRHRTARHIALLAAKSGVKKQRLWRISADGGNARLTGGTIIQLAVLPRLFGYYPSAPLSCA